MNVVISQPMYFPWVGMFEQIALADVFVFYTDVRYSKGSFTNRVQIKTRTGMKWMTVPLQNHRLGQRIEEVLVKSVSDWKPRHLALLSESLDQAPFVADAEALLQALPEFDTCNVGYLSSVSMLEVCRYFGLDRETRFVNINELDVGGAGSERVLQIVKSLGGSRYITGEGGRHYLDHEAFETAGIAVDYMNYQRSPYPQFFGPFTPFVSILDLVAQCGHAGVHHINPETTPWRRFINE